MLLLSSQDKPLCVNSLAYESCYLPLEWPSPFCGLSLHHTQCWFPIIVAMLPGRLWTSRWTGEGRQALQCTARCSWHDDCHRHGASQPCSLKVNNSLKCISKGCDCMCTLKDFERALEIFIEPYKIFSLEEANAVSPNETP